MPQSLSVIGGFFVRSLLWLVPALALWYWAREALVAPVAWLAERIMLNLFPGWVYGTELEGTTLALLTILEVPYGPQVIAELAPEVSVLSYCFGLPLLAALLLAARASGVWWKLPLGVAVLLPFQAWGVCFDLLVAVSIHAGDVTRGVTGFSALQVNLFGLGYQIGYLLLPTLVPMLLWIYLERKFVTTVAIDGAMSGLLAERRTR